MDRLSFLAFAVVISLIAIEALILLSSMPPEKLAVRELMDTSIARAVSYLTSFENNEVGMSYETNEPTFNSKYSNLSNLGDIWVATFMLEALQSQKSQTDQIRQKIGNLTNLLLTKQQANGFWPYDSHVNEDADTTLNVAITLLATEKFDPGQTRLTLLEYYKSSCEFKSFMGDYPHLNLDVHIEATSNAAYFLSKIGNSDDNALVECARKALRSKQNSIGYWAGYWYPSRYFITYLVLRALDDKDDHAKTALDFLVRSQNADGGWGNNASTAFDTSYALQSLLISDNETNSIDMGIAYLLKTQNPDGSWNGTTLFYFYKPNCSSNCTSLAHDLNKKLVSTASSLKALTEYVNKS